MLLRRFITHFERQDWLAIVLDFIIVVVGIFVGLQVDQWNDSRKERTLEVEYIAALKLDIEADIVALDEMMARARDRALLGRQVHAAMDSGRVDIEPADFVWAVYNTWLLNFPAYTRATFDELLSTGNLRLLQDASLKADIAAYYTEIELREQWSGNWRDAQIAMEFTLPDLLDFDDREAGMIRYNGGTDYMMHRDFQFDQDDAEEILQRILSHPSARGEIQNMTRIQDTHYSGLKVIREMANELMNRLDRAAVAI